MLAVGVVLIVLIFKISDALAAAYGIAVTGVMVISTVLVAVVARYRWNWKHAAVLAVFGVLGLIDLAFMTSNALKIVQGGWLPLAVAARHLRGDGHLAAWAGACIWTRMRDNALALDLFLDARRQVQPAHRRHRRVPVARGWMRCPTRCCTA